MLSVQGTSLLCEHGTAKASAGPRGAPAGGARCHGGSFHCPPGHSAHVAARLAGLQGDAEDRSAQCGRTVLAGAREGAMCPCVRATSMWGPSM